MPSESTVTKTYCNCVAQQRGLEPVGYAGGFTDAIVIEIPLPWKIDMYEQPGVLTQELIDLMALWLTEYNETGKYPHSSLAIAPDPEYSREGYRRVMFYTRPDGLFSHFQKVEYQVPEHLLGKLIWALYQAPENLSEFEQYRASEADAIRDLLVCTHGTVDAACAKFGFPLFKYMRTHLADDSLRVWRVSHFGGHVFAPTLMDMPIGHYWAYVEKSQAEQIVLRSGDVSAMRGYYRGWAGAENSFEQTIEFTLWQKHGWSWFDYAKRTETLSQDTDTDDPKWGEVRLTYLDPSGDMQQTCEGRVEVYKHIQTPYSTAQETTYDYPQYHLTRMDDLA